MSEIEKSFDALREEIKAKVDLAVSVLQEAVDLARSS